GASRSCCPTNSSNVRGRMRSASGAGASRPVLGGSSSGKREDMSDGSGPSGDGAALPPFSNQPTGDSAEYLHRVGHDVQRRLGKRFVDREDQRHKQQNG